MKSEDTEGVFELYVTRTPGYLWALFFKKLHVHPIAVTLLSIVIGTLAGYFFWFNDLRMNLIGMLLLVWANWYDCADGQLARMTGQKTLIGRILDGFAGDMWFFSIYLLHHPEADEPRRAVGLPVGHLDLAALRMAGFHCHAKQCALADYYRNIHLYILKGQAGSELDNYADQRALMRSLPWNGKEWFHKIYLYFYGNYTRSQEKMTPAFQAFHKAVPTTLRRKSSGRPQKAVPCSQPAPDEIYEYPDLRHARRRIVPVAPYRHAMDISSV